MKVDVIIPTYKPDRKFRELVSRLMRQSIEPERIIIMNTDSGEWDRLGMDDVLVDIGGEKKCEVYHVDKSSFDHGGTRNLGIKYSHSDYFICMTMDAIPRNDILIEELITPMDENIKLTYARQLPNSGAGSIERFTRHFNYPDESRTKSLADKKTLGIKTCFCSNVCAAYDRKVFDSLGGFTNHTIFNEDMVYADALLNAGYKIRYCANAQVYHSHEYNACEQFHRNFDVGVSQAEHPEVFGKYRSESEGIKLVQMTGKYLKKQGESAKIYRLLVMSAMKYAGFFLGKHFRALPPFLRRALSMNKNYWEKKVV